jgi:hypothetical protein
VQGKTSAGGAYLNAKLLFPVGFLAHRRGEIEARIPHCLRGAENDIVAAQWKKLLTNARQLFFRVLRLAQPCRNAQPEEYQQDSEKHASFGSNRSTGQPRWAKEVPIE